MAVRRRVPVIKARFMTASTPSCCSACRARSCSSASRTVNQTLRQSSRERGSPSRSRSAPAGGAVTRNVVRDRVRTFRISADTPNPGVLTVEEPGRLPDRAWRTSSPSWLSGPGRAARAGLRRPGLKKSWYFFFFQLPRLPESVVRARRWRYFQNFLHGTRPGAETPQDMKSLHRAPPPREPTNQNPIPSRAL
jgi:hypothetical protein